MITLFIILAGIGLVVGLSYFFKEPYCPDCDIPMVSTGWRGKMKCPRCEFMAVI